MSRISEIAKEMKTWWGNDGSDIEVQNALDEIIRLDEATDRKTEPQEDCETCKHYNPHHEAIACERCLDGKYSRYEPKTEPQKKGVDDES